MSSRSKRLAESPSAQRWGGKFRQIGLVTVGGQTSDRGADKDTPGGRHASSVAKLLRAIAASVSIAEPATGKDFSDHYAAGRNLTELIPIDQDEVAHPDNATPQRKSAAARLVEMARERYCLGCTDEGEPFGATQSAPPPGHAPPGRARRTSRRPSGAVLLGNGKCGQRPVIDRCHLNSRRACSPSDT